jgi:hypothetical protein
MASLVVSQEASYIRMMRAQSVGSISFEKSLVLMMCPGISPGKLEAEVHAFKQ